MKRHGFFLMLLAAAISMQFFSCKSAPAEKIDSVYVMVYDQDSFLCAGLICHIFEIH